MLGRGLESLIPNKNKPITAVVIPEEAGILTSEDRSSQPISEPLSTIIPQAVEAPVITPMPEPLESVPATEPMPEIIVIPEKAETLAEPATPILDVPPINQGDSGSKAGMTSGGGLTNGFEEKVYDLPVEDIKPNPHQPRKVFEEEALVDLTNSVKELGIIQPLVVSRALTKDGVEFFQLIAGERRLTAAKRAGLKTVPAIIKQIKEDRDNLELAIVENIQRSDLNPIEAARSYAKLQEEFGLTQREIAAKMGKSRETIVNVMRLLTLPTYIQEAIGSRQISDSQGRLLLSVSDPGEQRVLFDDILANNLSVRDVKIRLTRMRSGNFSLNQAMVRHQFKSTTPEISYLENKLQEALGTKVSVQLTNNGGKLLINFFSEDELKTIANRLIQLEGGRSEA